MAESAKTTSPRPNPLAHPTLREEDMCHVQHPMKDLGQCCCGQTIKEPFCCDQGQPRCGRPRCPECAMIYQRLTGKRRP